MTSHEMTKKLPNTEVFHCFSVFLKTFDFFNKVSALCKCILRAADLIKCKPTNKFNLTFLKFGMMPPIRKIKMMPDGTDYFTTDLNKARSNGRNI